jgi:hypothetical protein
VKAQKHSTAMRACVTALGSRTHPQPQPLLCEDTRHLSALRVVCIALLAVVTSVAIAACGSSSSAPNDGSTPVRTSAVKSHRDTVTSGVVTHRPLRGTGGKEANDDNPENSGPSSRGAASNPCRLVSRAEAQAIIGAPLRAPTEAPLGPTCLYQTVHNNQLVTLAVQSMDLAAVAPAIRGRRTVEVGGHKGYCGTYGQQTTLIPIKGGHVLQVTAPCRIGRLFAAKALARLSP